MNLRQIRKALSTELKSLDARRAKLQAAIKALGGIGSGSESSVTVRRKPNFSAAAKNRIAAAQRARWKKWRARKEK